MFIFMLVVLITAVSSGYEDNFDRYIITCHSTDFECFKRQYKALRDHALLGNKELNIEPYKPYVYQYGDSGTCVEISGIEVCTLVAVSMNNQRKEYSITLEMPIRIQQKNNGTQPCRILERDFKNISLHTGPLRRFSGNATVQATYPFELIQQENKTYLSLGEENLDVVVDVLDISDPDNNDPITARLSEWSNWANQELQQADLANKVVVLYTKRLRHVMSRIPLRRFLLLYPEEDYTNIQFTFSEKKPL